jgi:hypothetical protein
MCQILVSMRAQVTHAHRLKLQVISLPNLPHVRILIWSSLLPSIRVVWFTKVSKYGKRYAHAKAGAQDNKKNNQGGGNPEALVVSLLQGHSVDLWDTHRSQRMVSKSDCAVSAFLDGMVLEICAGSERRRTRRERSKRKLTETWACRLSSGRNVATIL